jgi:hypothetical protein
LSQSNRAGTSSSAICTGNVVQHFLLLRACEGVEEFAVLRLQ